MKKHVAVILGAVALSCAACTATNPSNSAGETTPGAATASPSVSAETPAPTSSAPGTETVEHSVAPSAPTATATFHQEGDAQPAALLTGTIVIEGRCVYVTNEQGPRTLVRFSDRGNPGIDGDTLSYDGHTYRTGDQADFGGGDSSGSSSDGIPAECDTSATFDAYPFPH